MNITSFIHARTWRWIAFALGVVVVLLLTFQLGVIVGYRKARFSYGWGENYHRNFGGTPRGFLPEYRGAQELMNQHGLSGSVIRIDGMALLMRGEDNQERVIIMNDQTIIRARRDTVAVTDIRADDRIVVLGEPNAQGQMQAKFIRLFR